MIIDFISSGNGINSFLKILMDWCEEEGLDPQRLISKIKIIRLAAVDNPNPSITLQVPVEIKTIFLSRAVINYLTEEAPQYSLGFMFTFWDWHNPQRLLHRPHWKAFMLQKQLQNYLNEN